ncbi:MAG TPA: hypothetical protein VMH86_10970 [Rhizomicrobium sp.]|nr:hypothetical protein [Rhizomicrobium sp.]
MSRERNILKLVLPLSAVVFIVVSVVVFGTRATSQQEPATPDRDANAPFSEFVNYLKLASSNEYVGHSGYRVESARAFDQMKQYLLERYGGISVNRSIELSGNTFDCMAIEDQPGLRQGGNAVAMPPLGGALPSTDVLPNYISEAHAASTANNCPPGTVPVERLTLAELAQFPTLEAFFARSASEKGPAPTVP